VIRFAIKAYVRGRFNGIKSPRYVRSRARDAQGHDQESLTLMLGYNPAYAGSAH